MNTLTKTLLAASAVAIAASTTALTAERGHGSRSGERFSMAMLERWDVDGDGAVTLEEFLTSTKDHFETADADEDGIVTEEELSRIAEERGNRRGMRHLERYDKDGDGKVSLEEVTQLALNRAKRRFNRADSDGDGFITAQEASKIGDSRTDRHAFRLIDRVMERFDVDYDGQVTKAEADQRRKIQFARFDANDDGQVTAEELQAGMKMFGGKHRRWGRGLGR